MRSKRLNLALRVILLRSSLAVAIESEADINGRASITDSDAIDPKRTFSSDDYD